MHSDHVRASNIRRFVTGLLKWYAVQGREFPWRKPTATKYQRVATEILLQRTRVETVSIFYKAFFKRYPSWKMLSLAEKKELEEVLKPVGLWRRRASVLAVLSTEMVKRHGRFPRRRSEIEDLPGVGQYVANAIELFCFNRPKPLLDGNMARLLERYFGPRKLADIRYDPYLQELAQRVVTTGNPVELNWAILDYAAMVCKVSRPVCHECRFHRTCKYLSSMS